MAWIESHQELARHPKTGRFARALNVSRATAIGHLHLLWWWALTFAQDGNLTKFTADEISEAAEWEGSSFTFTDALLNSGFMDDLNPDPFGEGSEHRWILHDWDDYAGRMNDKREQSKERMRRWRERQSGVTRNERVSNALTAQHSTVPDLTKQNKQGSTRESSAQGLAQHAPAAPPPVGSDAYAGIPFEQFDNLRRKGYSAEQIANAKAEVAARTVQKPVTRWDRYLVSVIEEQKLCPAQHGTQSDLNSPATGNSDALKLTPRQVQNKREFEVDQARKAAKQAKNGTKGGQEP